MLPSWIKTKITCPRNGYIVYPTCNRIYKNNRFIFEIKQLWNEIYRSRYNFSKLKSAIHQSLRLSFCALSRRRRDYDLIFWHPHQQEKKADELDDPRSSIGRWGPQLDYRLVASLARSHNNDNNNRCYNDDPPGSPVIARNSMASAFLPFRSLRGKNVLPALQITLCKQLLRYGKIITIF